MTLDGEEIEFSDGFGSPYTSYREILAGNGFGIEEATSAINLTRGRTYSENRKRASVWTASSTSSRGSFIKKKLCQMETWRTDKTVRA